MKVDKAITDVQDAERQMADHLRALGERHAVEHDLFHLGHSLAEQCVEHVQALAAVAERYGVKTKEPRTESAGIVEAVRHKGAELLGRSETTGLLLLHDLRSVYMTAQEAEIAWVILGQVAQAVRDPELIEVVTHCHEQADHRARWVRTRIKQTAPQVLATG